MTTFDLALARLPRGRRDIARIRYYNVPWGCLDLNFPGFGAGLSQIARFCTWARAWGLQIETPDSVTYAVACKRRHLLDFWERCYGSASPQTPVPREDVGPTLLKTQIEQLNPRKLFCFVGWEY